MSGAGERWIVNERAALIAYEAEHSTCDIQRHPWQAVFGAGFTSGAREVGAQADDEIATLSTHLAASEARVRELEAALDAARRDLVGFRDYLAAAGSVTTAQAIQRTLNTVDAALSGGSAVPEGE